jgi:ribosomal protein L7/L12
MSMTKFKVGDRVKSMSGCKEYIGAVGVIDLDDGSALPYRIKLDQPIEQWGDTHIWRTASTIELVPAWQPKVGDRVRYKKRQYGEATVIEVVGVNRVKVDTHGRYGICTENLDDLEPLPVAAEAQPASLTIEAGKFYKTRDGRKVGPVVVTDYDTAWGYTSDGSAYVFTATGRANYEGEHPDDYIAEWVDEPAEQPAVAVAASNDNAAPAKFKVGDKIRHKSLGHTGHITKIVGNDHAEVFWTNVGWGATDPFAAIELLAKPTPTAIVALIEDGQPKPSERPHVHATEAAAAKEAARLASVHKGQQFGVYVLTTTSQEPAPAYAHEWLRLAAKGEKIAAIKELRSVTGMQLKPAKDVVEHFVNYPYGQLAA